MGLGLLPGEQRGSQGLGGLFWGYRGKGSGGGPDPRGRSADTGSSPAASGEAHRPPRSPRRSRAPPRSAPLAGRTALRRSLAAGAARQNNAVSRSALPQPPAAIGCQAKPAPAPTAPLVTAAVTHSLGARWSRTCRGRPRPFSYTVRGAPAIDDGPDPLPWRIQNGRVTGPGAGHLGWIWGEDRTRGSGGGHRQIAEQPNLERVFINQ